jgi:hypothetical protein
MELFMPVMVLFTGLVQVDLTRSTLYVKLNKLDHRLYQILNSLCRFVLT